MTLLVRVPAEASAHQKFSGRLNDEERPNREFPLVDILLRVARARLVQRGKPPTPARP